MKSLDLSNQSNESLLPSPKPALHTMSGAECKRFLFLLLSLIDAGAH